MAPEMIWRMELPFTRAFADKLNAACAREGISPAQYIERAVLTSDAKAGAPEVEITQRMLLAGLAELPFLAEEAFGNVPVETLVAEVYRAMRRCEEPRILRHL